ncbi:LOW QUALITY PROTEIN: uncharacterized protein LOC124487232 [Hypomesus transpacificus]|uniref:LOW QUALITY PROTEIN: uncharacterized protein LOC124487232 n=1 Tax=Hypomesus transpacificus TaxID=137520 RepID=UPI001F079A5A|nr:LOW QUALITY PROTEIN: uncharacterized protein LOC124487232 [Hypomesus transpacificus]
MEPSAEASPESKSDCPICIGPLTDPYRLSLCSHEFCRQCLSHALKVNCHCPKCRGRVQPCDIMNINVDDASSNAALRAAQRFGIPLIGLRGQPVPAQERYRGDAYLGLTQLRLQLARSQLFLPTLTNQTPRDLGASSANNSTSATAHAASVTTRPAPYPPPRSAATLRPIPTPRFRPSGPVSASQQAPSTPVLPATPVLPISAPLPTTTHSSPFLSSLLSLSSDNDSDDQEDILEEFQFNQSIHLSQPLSTAVMTFSCPYCEEGGLDELDLLEHCNQNHLQDRRSVVCPVCVSLPHGNPTQVSRDFIAHLNLRHCYYTNDYTNISQSDPMNEQDAIFESYRANKQNSG